MSHLNSMQEPFTYPTVFFALVNGSLHEDVTGKTCEALQSESYSKRLLL